MAFTTHPTVVTGQTWSAANQNTYVKGNLDALWPFTTAGDLAYASAANTLARLALGTSGFVLKAGASAPAWALDPAIDLAAAKGDLLAASAADALARLAIGTNGQVLTADSTQTLGMKWAAATAITQRKGGSATDWSSPGTTTRTVSAVSLQPGVITVPMSGTPASGNVAVTFPTAFSNKPIILISQAYILTGPTSGLMELAWDSPTTTGFNIYAGYNAGAATYGDVVVSWLAIGPP